MESLGPFPKPDMNQPENLGTSIMAVSYMGGVIVGADSRTSMGSYVSNRVSDKLTPVCDRIYCCRSGSAAHTQAIADIVRAHLSMLKVELGHNPSVKTASHLFRDLCYKNKDSLLAAIICAGWDEQEGGSVYSVPLGGSLVKQDYSIGGSGSTYIYGFCDSYYRKDMTSQQCKEFVVRALSHAMARDGSSGGVIRLAMIDSSGVKRETITVEKFPVSDSSI